MDEQEKIELFAQWWDTYRASTTRFRDVQVAAQWIRLRVPAVEAAAWARSGWLPGEAAPLIAAGVTPQTAADLDGIATDVAGGPEERAMQEIDRLVEDGALVDPTRVRMRQDPDDPDHTIVHIDPQH